MTEYTPQQIAELKRHSQMLGRIAGWVSEFATTNEEATTEECVLELIARYRTLQSEVRRTGG
jgi:hypothetical protein